MEKDADTFSQDCLIPSEEYSEFILKSNFSEDSIINFSNKIIIDSGIVVDRLQKDGHIPYEAFNKLKKYMLAD